MNVRMEIQSSTPTYAFTLLQLCLICSLDLCYEPNGHRLTQEILIHAEKIQFSFSWTYML
jgi:hypothetical protein